MSADNGSVLQQLRAGRLQGAARLDLRGCGLSELPREVFALADSLHTLDLSGNAFTTLPDDLHRLQALRVLFCSNNRFETLPPVLGRCADLDLVGFRANVIAQVPAEALAAGLRGLILTDNRIESLPESLGDCTRLQKLMLSGNRLRKLPAAIARCARLELLRLAANRFESAADALPDGLLALPRLAWLAHAGNPFSETLEAEAESRHEVPEVAWSALQLRAPLGEGASGVIHEALWQAPQGPAQRVAVKLFKGALTSDGLPRSEMATCIAAGAHPGIVGVVGRLRDHPDGVQGLVLQLIPPGFRNLAGPPSLATCTRDVYADSRLFTPAQAQRIGDGITAALGHLHDRGLAHGDLYAHNILVDEHGNSLLSDFGAASFLPHGDEGRRRALQRMDRRAVGWLLEEIARCTSARGAPPTGDDAGFDPSP